jgi:hypothetical protein
VIETTTNRCARRSTVSATYLALMAAVACGSSFDESSLPPSEQCRDMVDALCAKSAECSAATDRTNEAANCLFALDLQISCDEVTVIVRRMEDCLNALTSIDCDSYDPEKEALPFPDDCKGVLGR